ncbi:MAG TPA: hypothetical protein VG271_10585 [Beijerinckiaceae bacterium]|nr:hypothetical protein [Beijerinckiaceae bacterium]
MATRPRVAKRTASPARRAAKQRKIAADILAQQRSDIADARDLYRHLVVELRLATQESAASEPDDTIVRDTDKKVPAAMMKAASLAGRAAVMKDLFSAMRILVDLERDVFDLAGAEETEAPSGISAVDAINASLARLTGNGSSDDH